MLPFDCDMISNKTIFEFAIKRFILRYFNIMKTDIQTVNFDASQNLVQFIENELYDLETEFDQIIGAEVYLRPGRSEQDHKTVKLKLNVPGPDLFAEFTANSYENGLIEAIEKVRYQLYKGSKSRRNGRK